MRTRAKAKSPFRSRESPVMASRVGSIVFRCLRDVGTVMTTAAMQSYWGAGRHKQRSRCYCGISRTAADQTLKATQLLLRDAFAPDDAALQPQARNGVTESTRLLTQNEIQVKREKISKLKTLLTSPRVERGGWRQLQVMRTLNKCVRS